MGRKLPFKNSENKIEPREFRYKCYKCGEKGHKASNCSKKNTATSMKTLASGVIGLHDEQNKNSAVYAVEVKVGDHVENAMVDCGCTGCIVTNSFAERVGLTVNARNNISTLADGSQVKTVGVTEFSIRICDDEIELKNVQVWQKLSL